MFYFLSAKEIALFLCSFFLTELRINVDKGGYKEGDRAERHHNNKECGVAHSVLQEAAEHARHLQAKVADTCTDGVVRCFEFAHSEIEHIERQGGKAHTVAELFNENACADEQHVGGQGEAHVDVDDVWQSYGAHHRP